MNSFFPWVKGTKGLTRRGRQTGPRWRQGSRLTFEGLEDRRMMAINVYYDDGFRDGDYEQPALVGIHIIGTVNQDHVEVSEANGRILVVATEANGRVKRFAMDARLVPQIFFDGRAGDDVYISKSAAVAYIYGGGDDDTLSAGWGEVHVWGGGGDDTLSAGSYAYGTFDGGAGVDTLYGTANNNVMFGGTDTDFLYGRGGGDYLRGGEGDDFLYGGDDRDTLIGDIGNDYLHGGDGNDDLYGGENDDDLNGGPGEDTLYGNEGWDELYGGGGRTLDHLFGGSDPDVFWRDAATFDSQESGFAGDHVPDFNESEGDVKLWRNSHLIWGEVPGIGLGKLAGKSSGFKASQTADAPLDELAFDEPVFEVPSWRDAYVAELNAEVLAGILAEEAPSVTDGDETTATLVAYLQTLDLGVSVVESETDDEPGAEATGPDHYEEIDNYFGDEGDADQPSDGGGDDALDDDSTTYEDVDDAFGDDPWSDDALSKNSLGGFSGFGG